MILKKKRIKIITLWIQLTLVSLSAQFATANVMIATAHVCMIAAGERVKPIPVSEYSRHVERLHADRDKLFEMEYEVSGLYKTRNKNISPGPL